MAESRERKQVEVVIEGQKFVAKAKDFKSGNKGFGLYGAVKIADKTHRIILNLISLGKEKAKAEAAETA